MDMYLLLGGLVGFACGSIPFALIVAKAFKLPDPREYGSGNPGATNVMRSGNKLAGRLVFICDCGKGLVPTLWFGLAYAHQDAAAVCAAMTVAGHVWSPWLNFRGGRGVATGFGALFGMDWRFGLVAVAVWTLVYFPTKVVSLASTGAFVVAMLVSFWVLERGELTAVSIAAITLVIVLRHKQNFKDLLKRQERKF